MGFLTLIIEGDTGYMEGGQSGTPPGDSDTLESINEIKVTGRGGTLLASAGTSYTPLLIVLPSEW